MSLSITDFWDLLIESRLVTPQDCQLLASQFANSRSSTAPTPKVLAEWLAAQRAITRFQARVLLSGRAGPFFFAGYRVDDTIEAGRLTGFHRGVHVNSGHPVLMSFLTGPLVNRPADWAEFVTHAQQQIAIKSPYLLSWYDLVETSSHRILVMEVADGASLDEELRNCPILAPVEALQAIAQAAHGLAELHAAGVAHGDIRPYNLWLCSSGTVKLFREIPGLSQERPTFAPGARDRPVDSDQADYLAPEFLLPGKQPDHLTDIYALGCTFYEVLTGTRPFSGGDPSEKLKRHAAEPIRPLSEFGVPANIAQVVTYMMAKNPAVRVGQAAQIGQHLTKMLGAQQPPEPVPLPTEIAFEAILRKGTAGRATSRQLPTMTSNGAAYMASPPADYSSSTPGLLPDAPTITPPIFSNKEVHHNRAPLGPGVHAGPPPGLVELDSLASNVSAASKQDVSATLPQITTSASPIAVRNAARKNTSRFTGRTIAIAGGILACVGILAFVLARAFNSDSNHPASDNSILASDPINGSSQTNSDARNSDSGQGGPESAPAMLATDDGKSLWAAPSSNVPLDFRLLPAGAQMFVHVRPADLLAHPEGERVIKALGPSLEELVRSWEQSLQIHLRDVESLLIAFLDDPATLRPTVVVRTKDPSNIVEMMKFLGNPQPQPKGELQVFSENGWTFARPIAADKTIFVMGSKAEIDDIVERNGEAPPPNRWIDRLRLSIDEHRMFSVLFTLHSLETEVLRDGRDWSSVGNTQRLRSSLEWLLGDEVLAACLSMHLDASFYLELRLISALKKDRHTIASELRTRLDSLPELVEVYLAQLQPISYWGNIAFRFPSMLRYLHDQTRVGVDGDQAVVNAYLPAVAAHNLLLGGSLAIASTPGVTTSSEVPAPKAKGLKEVLATRMSVDIPQQDLVFAIGDIEKMVNDDLKGLANPFKIKMMGNDLKVAGITQNQKVVDFRHQNVPLEDILTALIKRANPNTSPSTPADQDKELVWSMGADPDNRNQQIVFVTTRAGAARDGHKLPPAFTMSE